MTCGHRLVSTFVIVWLGDKAGLRLVNSRYLFAEPTPGYLHGPIICWWGLSFNRLRCGPEEEASVRYERIALNAPLKYRTTDSGWFEGETINISDTGVLFYCEQLLEPGTAVDVYLVLKTPDGDEFPPLTVASGKIVRQVPSREHGLPAMAVSIQDRKFLQDGKIF